MNCRFDNQPLSEVFLDLINSPAANSFLTREQLEQEEAYYPLKLFVNERNFLVQVDEFKFAEDIFNHEYVYYSSFSRYWLKHAADYCDMIERRLALNQKSFVVEIASNDGYLLKNFVQKGIPCLGVEPTANTAEKAKEVGVSSEVVFFHLETAKELEKKYRKADLIIGNNVFAHVPDINGFVSGLKQLLAEKGTITLEFPHLYQLIAQNQFDTIYHEHFWYFSLTAVQVVFAAHGLRIYSVEELGTHGGSLRIYACHEDNLTLNTDNSVQDLLQKEEKAGMKTLEYYRNFAENVKRTKLLFVKFLTDAKLEGKKIAGYGAAAKGNTLMNYCGVKNDMIDFVVDASPYKQNLYLPGSHIPVVSEDKLREEKPDYIVIFPWNLKDEITEQLSYTREWGARFVIPIPSLTVI